MLNVSDNNENFAFFVCCLLLSLLNFICASKVSEFIYRVHLRSAYTDRSTAQNTIKLHGIQLDNKQYRQIKKLLA